jgi:2-methylcitrate dehydratase PrpD
MAVAAVVRDLGFDVQQSPPELPPAVRDFMGKIKVAADDSLLADYPRTWRARVNVVASAGAVEHEVTTVPGDPAWPFGRDVMQSKFLGFVAPVFGEELAQFILKRCGEVLATAHFGLLVDEIEASCAHRLPRE